MEVIKSNRLLTLEKKAEDIAFYEDQKGERKAVMNGMDKVFQKGLRKQQLRKQPRITTEEQPTSSLSSDEFSSPGFSSSGGSGNETDYGEEAGPSSRPDFISLSAPRNFINNTEITKVFDRLKLTDNAATMLVSAFLKTCKREY